MDIEITAFDESTHTAQEAADAIGVNLGQIVKSLVFMAPRTRPSEDSELVPVVALVRGTDRVDIGVLATVSGRPRLRRAWPRKPSASRATASAACRHSPTSSRRRW